MPKRDFPMPDYGTIMAAVIGGAGTRNTRFKQTGLRKPMMSFVIDAHGQFVTGAAAYAKDIDKLGMSFKSFSKPLKESLDQVIIPSIIQNFASQGRPPWVPLKPGTIKDRQYKGFPRGPILDRTGRLKKAARRKNNWEIQTHMLKFRSTFFTQSVPYAGFHQRGSLTKYNTPTGHIKTYAHHPPGVFSVATHDSAGAGLFKATTQMPARPFLQITEEEEVVIYSIFVSFMQMQVAKYWKEGDNL